MKSMYVLLLTVLLPVTVVCLLNSCEKECNPCDTSCPDPSERFIGVWIIFEAYYNGYPYPDPVGMGMDFRSGDSLIAFSDTLKWYATDEHLIIIQENQLLQMMAIAFEYYFEVDTLDITGSILGDTIRYRMLEEENMP